MNSQLLLYFIIPCTYVKLYCTTQANYRKIQELGLTCRYAGSSNFRLVVRILMALAFLPINEVNRAFEILDQIIRENIADLGKFLDYFQTQWMFLINQWNVHSHHLRTNNDLEAWHFAMLRSLKRPHPDIFTFIGIKNLMEI